MAKTPEIINGKVVKRWFSRGKARIPVFEDGTIGVPSKASDISRSEYHQTKKGLELSDLRKQRSEALNKYMSSSDKGINKKVWHKSYEEARKMVRNKEKELETYTNDIYEDKNASKMIDYNAKTRAERYRNYNTEVPEHIKASEAQMNRLNEYEDAYDAYDKAMERANTTIKEGTPLKNMANDRIKEKQGTLENDKIMLDYMKRKGINEINGYTQKDFENRISKNEKYLATANDKIDTEDRKEFAENANRTPEEYNLISKEDAYNQAVKELGYPRHTSDYDKTKEIYARQQEIINNNPQIKEFEDFKENTYKQVAKELGYKRHTSDEKQNREIYEKANKIIEEYKNKKSGIKADKKLTISEVRKELRNMNSWSDEKQYGNIVVTKTGNTGYHIRNVNDVSDPQTDYFAGVYGVKEKQVLKTLEERGFITNNKDTKAKVERFKERKGITRTNKTPTKRELASKIVDDQIKRGIVKKENREMQIKWRLNNMTKDELEKASSFFD